MKIECYIDTGSTGSTCTDDYPFVSFGSTLYKHLELLGARIERERNRGVLIYNEPISLEFSTLEDLQGQLKTINCKLEISPHSVTLKSND